MAAYDPKRPRPTAEEAGPAPVEALLDPDPVEPVSVEPVSVEPVSVEPDPVEPESVEREPAAVDESADVADDAPAEERRIEVDLREPSLNGSGARPASEVPVAAAPEEGTANRAVLIAGLSAAGLVALLLVILLRRRRRVD